LVYLPLECGFGPLEALTRRLQLVLDLRERVVLSTALGGAYNVAMGLGAVEIFFILVVVALVVYVLWRLLIRPRR
jgi:hypothetical protein